MNEKTLEQQIIDINDRIWELQQIIRYDSSISEKRCIEVQLEIIQLAYKVHMMESRINSSMTILN